MENRYPLFAGGRILKKEALWDLRDYTYGSLQIVYADYTDGIVRGCAIRVEGNCLIIGKGLLKYGDFLYLMKEEAAVSFMAANRLTVLKAVFSVDGNHPDYLSCKMDFLMDEDAQRQKNQIELCRFHLREGSVLRDVYKDFSDQQTRYDTVILTNATVAGRGEERLHPAVLLRFAEELQERGEKDAADMAFCYEIRNHTGEVERMTVLSYLADKGTARMEAMREWDNEKLIGEMEKILQSGGRTSGWERQKNVIYVE